MWEPLGGGAGEHLRDGGSVEFGAGLGPRHGMGKVCHGLCCPCDWTRMKVHLSANSPLPFLKEVRSQPTLTMARPSLGAWRKDSSRPAQPHPPLPSLLSHPRWRANWWAGRGRGRRG